MARNRRNYKNLEIAPDEIFLDSSNLPEFDSHQFEGRLEKPIGQKTVFITATLFILLALIFIGRAYFLQIKEGKAFAQISEDNHLQHTLIFSDRGVIKDRNGIRLAWNVPPTEEGYFATRQYVELSGLNNLLGFVRYPSKDSNGFFYKEEVSGQDGIEKYFNEDLAGKNGLRIVEANSRGEIKSQSTIRPPEAGKEVTLSIDSKLTNLMYKNIQRSSELSGFQGGAGVVMDINSGEVLAVTTFPEYNSQVLTNATDTIAINSFLGDSKNVFLDRAVSGLYAPGSIVKPFLAIGALNEGIISPDKKILSTGSISIPNPYFPDKPSIFRDWRVNGWTNMQEAIAVSSDVYFYAVGGGYQDQKGLGINNIDKYMEIFGFGKPISNSFFTGKGGVIPTPEWKAANFDGDQWRIGDTYHTAIGQFGFQMTPIQAARAVAAIANNGYLITPVVKKGEQGEKQKINQIPNNYYPIVKEGMRMAVTQGTMTGLNFSDIKIAGKTGTAEVGTTKSYVNSWVVGFFPYENPKYAFALILEKGPTEYREGAQAVMQNIFREMKTETPEYLDSIK